MVDYSIQCGGYLFHPRQKALEATSHIKKIECQQAEGDRVRMIGLSPMTTDNRLRTTEAGGKARIDKLKIVKKIMGY